MIWGVQLEVFLTSVIYKLLKVRLMERGLNWTAKLGEVF